MSEKIIEKLQEEIKEHGFVIVCIGTDNHVWDSLGPITGSLLKRDKPKWIVYGTLKRPITALNINKMKEKILEKHPTEIIIAIDLAIGYKEDDNEIFIRNRGLKPGTGVGRTDLEKIGDYSIIYSINKDSALNNKRIRKPYSGAEKIVNFLKKIIK